MSDSPAFECSCDKLQELTSLTRLEVRGTVRIALREAGLSARTVSPAQAIAVAEQVLPGMLSARGVDGPLAVCNTLCQSLAALQDPERHDDLASVFQRIR